MERKMLTYRNLLENEICRQLFLNFIRHQVVAKCWRKHNGQWTVEDAPFIDEWTEVDYKELVLNLQKTVRSSGFVYAAFYNDQLKGFVSVESNLFGSAHQYLDLTNIYVSEDMRKCGIGKVLFNAAKVWAEAHSAKKLYISAHSAVESQEFYRSMGCIEATEYNQSHVEKEPFDCQLECVL